MFTQVHLRHKKKPEPVHTFQNYKNEEEPSEYSHRTYSGQFIKPKKHKHRSPEKESFYKHQTLPEIPELDQNSQKISKKTLQHENQRLQIENDELKNILSKSDEIFSDKVEKIRDKLNTTQKYNEDLSSENAFIKQQYQNLSIKFEQCVGELEKKKTCNNCLELNSALEKYNTELNLSRQQNYEIEQDSNMLKTVIYRLNVQLERYQDKLRKYNVKLDSINANYTESKEIPPGDSVNCHSDIHQNHPHVPISWGKVNTHTLAPLLNAYQDTIEEKQEIIQSHEEQLSKFTGKLQEIVRENESLHKKLTEDDGCSIRLKAEVDKLQKDAKSLREQNDLLIKKCALKQDKLEEVLKVYDQKVEQLNRDYNVVVDQYHKSNAEIASLKERNKSLIDSQEDFRNERQNYIPISVHTASVNECKKWYEELKQQYEREKVKLKEAVDNFKTEITDLNNRISSVTAEKEEYCNKTKLAEKQIKKLETKYLELQHTLNEIQVSRSACRKQLHKAMNFAKDLVAEQERLLEALHQRQQENKVVKQIGSDVASRMDSLKSQLKTVQKEAWQELSTVEQRFQEQQEFIANMKQEYEEEVAKLKHIIKEKGSNPLPESTKSSNELPHYLLFRDKNKS